VIGVAWCKARNNIPGQTWARQPVKISILVFADLGYRAVSWESLQLSQMSLNTDRREWSSGGDSDIPVAMAHATMMLYSTLPTEMNIVHHFNKWLLPLQRCVIVTIPSVSIRARLSNSSWPQ
jgi:hypothetical protein